MAPRPNMKNWLSLMWKHRMVTDTEEWQTKVAFDQMMLANGFDRRSAPQPEFPQRETLD